MSENNWEDDNNTIWVKCSKCETEYRDLMGCSNHICPKCNHREDWDDIS